MLSEGDTNGDNKISLPEFLVMMEKVLKIDQVEELFKKYSANKKSLSTSEFRKFLEEEQGESLSEHSIFLG